MSQPQRWSWPQYLACIAVPILVLNAWTMLSWLAEGPEMVTEYRDGRTIDWYAARVAEGVVIVVSIWVLYRLIRGCRAERKLLTFDVMFVLVAATQTWADFAMHFFQPLFAVSSNWVNLNNPCGNIPLVVNPDCGRAPDPILFLFLLETFVMLALAWGGVRLVGRMRKRHPDWSQARLFGIVVAYGCAIALFEPLLMIPFELWSYPGAKLAISMGEGLRYPIFPELIGLGLYFAVICSVYVFRDDRGLRFVERGLERYTPRLRKVITMLALYTVIQSSMWIFGNAQLWPVAFFSRQWEEVPAYLNNGMCDSHATTGTRYGPCPGTPGYRMPVSESGLPGESPP